MNITSCSVGRVQLSCPASPFVFERVTIVQYRSLWDLGSSCFANPGRGASTNAPTRTSRPRLDVSRRTFLKHAAFGVGACIFGTPLIASTRDDRTLHLNTAFGPPISTPDRTGFFDRLMREAAARLGYTVEIQTPPAERALMLANSGIDDGDGPRIPDLENHWDYPHLVRVEESLLDIEFVAFSRKAGIQITDWESLARFEVAIVTGWKILERHLSRLPDLVKVKDAEHLFLVLKHRRTDLAIIDRYSGVAMANRVGLRDYVILSPPLASTPMFLYLHTRHTDLAPRMSAVLRDMKADGTYRHIRQETLDHVHSRPFASR